MPAWDYDVITFDDVDCSDNDSCTARCNLDLNMVGFEVHFKDPMFIKFAKITLSDGDGGEFQVYFNKTLWPGGEVDQSSLTSGNKMIVNFDSKPYYSFTMATNCSEQQQRSVTWSGISGLGSYIDRECKKLFIPSHLIGY